MNPAVLMNDGHGERLRSPADRSSLSSHVNLEKQLSRRRRGFSGPGAGAIMPCAATSSRAGPRIAGHLRTKTRPPRQLTRPPIATVTGAPIRSAIAPGESEPNGDHPQKHHRIERHHAPAKLVRHHRLNQRVGGRELHHHRESGSTRIAKRKPIPARRAEKNQRSAQPRRRIRHYISQAAQLLPHRHRQRAEHRSHSHRAHQRAVGRSAAMQNLDRQKSASAR